MLPSEIKDTFTEFLRFIEFPSGNTKEREIALVHLADRISLCICYDEPDGDEREFPSPQTRDYNFWRGAAEKSFPNLGNYQAVWNITYGFGSPENVTGDAIDDIADIAGDLEEIVWRFENTSEADALWHLHLSYDFHFGRHLRSLQLFMYEYLRTGYCDAP